MKTLSLFIFLFTTSLVFGQHQTRLDSLIHKATIEKDVQKKALLLSDLSWEFASNDLEKSILYADKAIGLGTSIKNQSIIADAYNSKGLAYDYSGNLEQSLVWYKQSLTIRIDQKKSKKIANVYNNIGATYYYNARYEKALENYIKALSYREKDLDSFGIAQSYNNIGLVHRTQKNFIKAKSYYLKSLQIKASLKDAKGMIYPLTNLSVLSQNLQEYDVAEDYILKALAIAEEHELQKEIGIQKSNLGANYLLQKEYQQAILFLAEAKAIFKANGKDRTLGIIQLKLGESYIGLKLFNKASIELLEALAIAKRVKKLELQQNILSTLSKMEKQRNNFAEAYVFLTQSNKIKDSIFGVEKFKSLSDIEAKYQNDKKEQQIKTLNLKVEKDKAERKLWLIGGVLASLMLLMLGLFLFLNNKKSIKLKEALADRETLLKEIHHRVKNNLQIVSSLLNLQTRYMKDDVAINAVKDSKNRVNSMALIHQKLYQNDSLTGVEMEDYIQDLVESLFYSFGMESNQFRVKATSILLDVDTVIPIGLILNELIINAIKHNLREEVEVNISFAQTPTHLELIVKDTGKGIADDFDYTKSESYGMKLIHSLAKKLNANVIFENRNGLQVSILIKDYKIIG